MEKRPKYPMVLYRPTTFRHHWSVRKPAYPHTETRRICTAVGHIHARLLSISHLYALPCEFHDGYVSVSCECHRQRQLRVS